MEKMRFETPDLSQCNIEKIEALFPSVITESKDENGKLKKAIDFGKLRLLLGDETADECDERYEFTWVGKRRAMVEAGKPIRKTLRPCVEESKNWENTENLYIEGDNLDVLKLLQESYLGKVKMIYIDPPYNTGNDFVYRDDFTMSREEYDEETGVYDEEDNRLFRNTESNGRFHSDWCSMMYPRLVLARNLLRDNGVIFISIDDGEIAQLRKICDEVFGEANFVAQVVWQKIHSIKNDARYFSVNHDFALIYAKHIDNFRINRLSRTEEMNSRYKNPDNDPRGPWQSGDLVANGERSTGYYDVASPISGKIFNVELGKHWVYSQENLMRMIENNEIWFGIDGNSFPRKKRFLSDVQDGRTPNTIWLSEEVGHNQTASREVRAIFDDKSYFDYPKPVSFIKQMIQIGSKDSNDIILDFFSGSATTAHAVMQLNAEDGGNRKFIMVQLLEKTDEKSEAYKTGYKNICEIGKERIRRAGEKIKEENQAKADIKNLDIGFRVLKVDDSNMEDVYYAAGEYTQELLSNMESNIKAGRTDMDLLYGCLLEWGLSLSLPHKTETMDGVTVHTVNESRDKDVPSDLIACFADNISETIIQKIARRQPMRAVFHDRSFSDSAAKINVGEIFKLLAPNTKVKVI